MTQITLKMNPEDNVSRMFFSNIETRDKELYPTIFSYLNAAVEALEVSAGGRDFPVLAEEDLRRIEITVLVALRKYEQKKKEEQMVP